MREFQDRQKNRRRLYSKTTIAILVILLILMARSTWNIYQKEQESQQNKLEANKELAVVQARHDLLQSQINRLQTPAGQEEEIRQKYQVAKPGEDMVVIIDSTTTSTSTPVQQGVFSGLWSTFVGLFK
jgi:cell division protein FtsB